MPGCNENIDIFSNLWSLITLDNYAFLIFVEIVQNSLERGFSHLDWWSLCWRILQSELIAFPPPQYLKTIFITLSGQQPEKKESIVINHHWAAIMDVSEVKQTWLKYSIKKMPNAWFLGVMCDLFICGRNIQQFRLLNRDFYIRCKQLAIECTIVLYGAALI